MFCEGRYVVTKYKVSICRGEYFVKMVINERIQWMKLVPKYRVLNGEVGHIVKMFKVQGFNI